MLKYGIIDMLHLWHASPEMEARMNRINMFELVAKVLAVYVSVINLILYLLKNK